MSQLIELKDDRSEKVHYDISGYPVYIRDGLLSHYPGYTAPNHWHNDIELIAVLSGKMSYNVNGEITTLQSGSGIFINSGQMHFGFSDTRSECSFICILLHPILLCASPSYERDFVQPIVCNHTAPFVVLDSETAWKQKILEQIHFMRENNGRKTTPLKVLTAFSAIWSLLYENLPSPSDSAAADPQSSDLTITKNMVGFIQKNYAHKISLMDIAVSGAVGQSKCCKLFTKYFSQTPNLYLNRYRLNKSMELLQNTDLSVTEIALSVGFGGASYYAETFRKWIGISPTEFRKKSAAATV